MNCYTKRNIHITACSTWKRCFIYDTVFTSPVLSILNIFENVIYFSSSENRLLIGEYDGIDVLLQQLAVSWFSLFIYFLIFFNV